MNSQVPHTKPFVEKTIQSVFANVALIYLSSCLFCSKDKNTCLLRHVGCELKILFAYKMHFWRSGRQSGTVGCGPDLSCKSSHPEGQECLWQTTSVELSIWWRHIPHWPHKPGAQLVAPLLHQGRSCETLRWKCPMSWNEWVHVWIDIHHNNFIYTMNATCSSSICFHSTRKWSMQQSFKNELLSAQVTQIVSLKSCNEILKY